jgi:hypothetical protein
MASRLVHAPVVVRVEGTNDAIRAAICSAGEAHQRQFAVRVVQAHFASAALNPMMPLYGRESPSESTRFAVADGRRRAPPHVRPPASRSSAASAQVTRSVGDVRRVFGAG